VLHPSEWSAGWIGTPAAPSKKAESALYPRGSLSLDAEVVRARAYVSALGWYRLFINGEDLTGNVPVPRWAPYDEIVEYQTYDVAQHFKAGLSASVWRSPSGKQIVDFGQYFRRHRAGPPVRPALSAIAIAP
jgi:alpha-L-rhamnosidase